ncbi:MAG TPA: UDP-N-acetylmuramoyl-tripeptide--D-alanyl-D-alanine ligase [Pyrinomonadaceae bacterium]|nr:UDP-N-acetylmuramoyl-tripeptide--D-alanyl-D-alanine ligase [Pyrinomonadaceae bacterium]
MRLENAIKFMNADAVTLSPALLSAEVNSFVIDSREVQAGAVFFALSQPEYKNNCFNGDFEDSTKYVGVALENGAVAAVVRRDRFAEHNLEEFKDRLIFAEDVIVAFQNLAHGVYAEWNKPVVAVTGSAGKTTAKELTAHVLASFGRKVLRNIKNYNNGLGLPITVLNLAQDSSFDVAVLEMGMSTPNNEIARLCGITPPDVAVELNVLPVHVEHLGSIENVAKAKAELVEGMKIGGTAVLNADDFRVLAMRELHDGKNITYGIENQADVMAKNIRFERFGETTFDLQTPNGSVEVSFPLNGKHNILNALAASAVGVSFGMTAQEIAESLKTVAPPPQRGEVLHFAEGFTVVNDTYNSNPDALISMVQTMIDGGNSAKRKIVVAGEMRELGNEAQKIHFETGQTIAALKIDKLFGVEGFAEDLLQGANLNGEFYENSTVAAEKFVAEVQAGDLVLVKGSRGVRTEKVIEKLLEKFELEK